MKRYFLCFFILICLTTVRAETEPFQNYLIEHLDALVEETFIIGYNFDNSAVFYKHFAQKMKPIKGKDKYETLYKNTYKKELGYMEDRSLLREKSIFDSDFPVLVYEAEFQNYQKVLVTVHFVKENSRYCITNIKFEKIHN